MAQGVLRSPALRDVVRGRIQLSIARVVSILKTANGTSAWFDAGSVIRSIKYAASIGAPVLNWSIESPRQQLELESQLLLSPTLLAVTAAGNSKTYLNQDERHPAYLVKYLPERVIVVGAHGPDGSPWKRSSYGDEVVDLSAPGCHIDSMGFGGARKIAHGTSLAAPLVSFTAALLHAHGLDSAQDKKRRIVASTTPERRLAKRVRSGGRLDIPKAIAVLDDVIVVRGEDGGPDRMLRGRIDEPDEWDVCGEINPIVRVEKVSPHAVAEPLSTRVILNRPGGGNAILLCPEPKGTLKFRELLNVDPLEYGPEQIHPIASLVDIVPAWFP